MPLPAVHQVAVMTINTLPRSGGGASLQRPLTTRTSYKCHHSSSIYTIQMLIYSARGRVFKGTVGRSGCSDSCVMVFTGDTGKTRRSESETMREHQCTWVVALFLIGVFIHTNSLHSHGCEQQRIENIGPSIHGLGRRETARVGFYACLRVSLENEHNLLGMCVSRLFIYFVYFLSTINPIN